MRRAPARRPDPTLLSQSEADYRQSLVLFEELYRDYPTDRRVRRYYAEALGTWGWGWLQLWMKRNEEARPHYERAVQLLRELIREAGTSATAGTGAATGPPGGVTSVLSDLASLGSTVHTLGTILENLGESEKASEVRRQLDDDVNVLAAHSQSRHAGSSGRNSSWEVDSRR